jgi:hypothetical protein
MAYMLTKTEHRESVYRNLGFYVDPLGSPIRNHPVPRDVAGPDFHPSSVSFLRNGLQNVRFVNYIIDRRNGSYSMKEGGYSPDHLVRTRNVLWDGNTARLLQEDTKGLTPRESRIRGLEDVRTYIDSNGKARFVATSCEFSPKIRMVGGVYDTVTARIHSCAVLEPPTETDCEKNWLPVSGTDDIVYRWFPLEVGSLEGNRMVVHTTHATPWFFSHLRGSAVPIAMGSDLWVLTHFVEYSQPRKYYHCFVALDGKTYAPKSISLPFVFKAQGIEYCLGCSVSEGQITCVFSSWDDNPSITTFPASQLEWIQI